jgi:DMSO/TMAO reductase YedYZ molybdopterin-dependent catalytic subunit
MKAKVLSWSVLILALVSCTAPAPAVTVTAVPLDPTPCQPEPITVPTPPAEVPGYTELDPSTGLHMTGTVPDIDFGSYRLEVTGKVDNPLSLSYDELRCMPKIEIRCTLTCPGFFVDEATWAGASLDHVLSLAGMQEEATGLRLVSADGYASVVYLTDLPGGDNFVAYEWEGEPVPIIHGFPVRAVFTALNGNRWVKWLVEIEVF